MKTTVPMTFQPAVERNLSGIIEEVDNEEFQLLFFSICNNRLCM